MKIFPARGWHLWYVNPPSSLSSSCAFSSLFTPIALSTVATAPISSNLPRRQKLTFLSVLNLLPSEEKRGKLFWSFWLKGILSQIYDHCSEVFLRLESKICTVQSSQIDKKLPKRLKLHYTSYRGSHGVTGGGAVKALYWSLNKDCLHFNLMVSKCRPICTCTTYVYIYSIFYEYTLPCTGVLQEYFQSLQEWKTFWMYSNLENFKSKK